MTKSTLSVVKDAFSAGVGGNGGREIDDIEHNVSALQRTIDLINSLNEQIDIIAASIDEADESENNVRKKRRLVMLNEAVESAFTRLNYLSK